MTLAQQLQIQTPSPMDALTFFSGHTIWCKRDDMLHPIISGNKWRKLQPLLRQALHANIQHIGSFGGAYSNHLHALGYACHKLNIKFTAIVRAHPDSAPTPMLRDLKQWGVTIQYVSREDYKLRALPDYTKALVLSLRLDLLIPEGGSDGNNLSGVGTIMEEIQRQEPQPFDLIVLPVASGGTMAGLIKYIAEHNLPTRVLGIAVLKGQGYLERSIIDLLATSANNTVTENRNWKILHDEAFHGGGYAKVTSAHAEFRQRFFQAQGFMLDRVYNTKSFFALNQLLNQHKYDAFKRIMLLHTGGLQGDR